MIRVDNPLFVSGISQCDHTFAICAYGCSPYLETCIESVISQDITGSEIFIATSTPSSWLNKVGEKYHLPVIVNNEQNGIGADWNFAYAQATRSFVTIAHQDDYYCPDYLRNALSYLVHSKNPIIFFSNYGEIRNGVYITDSRLLQIKRRMLAPLKFRRMSGSIFMRRRILSFGSAICCPSVTFSRKTLPNPPFVSRMKSNLDWDTWEQLSQKRGDFLYCPEILMYHRIHEASTTTQLIEDNTRAKEDLQIFRRFWPDFIARVLAHYYSSAQDDNML